MSRPHPALMELAAGRPLPEVHDFAELLRSAREHRMTGLLWSRVEAGEIDGPRDWTRTLAQINLATRQHHQRLWDALEDVTNRLDREGIRVATFKGVTAEARWYDRQGERPCGDLDLWVAPDDLRHFGEIVRLLQPDHPLGDTAQDLVDRGYLQGIDIKLETGIWVDLHADLFKLGLRSRTAELIWNRTEEFSLSNRSNTRVLDAEATLVQLLLHLNVDSFARLGRFTDVLRVLDRANLDWKRFAAIVETDRIEVPVYNSLGATLEPFSMSVPISTQFTLRCWLWEQLWATDTRMLGDTAARWRLRQRAISFLSGHSVLESAASFARRAFPDVAILNYFYPDLGGPYFWRIFSTRIRYQRDWHKHWAGQESP